MHLVMPVLLKKVISHFTFLQSLEAGWVTSRQIEAAVFDFVTIIICIYIYFYFSFYNTV